MDRLPAVKKYHLMINLTYYLAKIYHISSNDSPVFTVFFELNWSRLVNSRLMHTKTILWHEPFFRSPAE